LSLGAGLLPLSRKALPPRMRLNSSPKAIVIGIGNECRGDDAAGLLAARQLRELAPEQVTVLEQGGEGAQLMEAWRGASRVFIVDAVCSGALPGTTHCFDASVDPIPATLFRHSTHAFGLAAAVELGRVLKQLPARLIVYGIEGRNFEAGAELSAAVRTSLDRVVRELLERLNSLKNEPKNPSQSEG
jgi:hydrogenase maturation protease